MKKILIIEDDTDINNLTADALKKAGYRCTQAFSGTEGLLYVSHEPFDLVIMDLMLPGLAGEALLPRLKEQQKVPVIVISAKDSLDSKLNLLEAGAEDYLTKPFLPKELTLRLAAVIRRTYLSGSAARSSDSGLVLGNRTVHFDRSTVSTPDGEITLTAKELLILRKLYENRGKIVTFDALCDAVWGDGYYTYENTLMVHIRRLREKIEEEPSHPRWLLTARGIGYRLEQEGKV